MTRAQRPSPGQILHEVDHFVEKTRIGNRIQSTDWMDKSFSDLMALESADADLGGVLDAKLERLSFWMGKLGEPGSPLRWALTLEAQAASDHPFLAAKAYGLRTTREKYKFWGMSLADMTRSLTASKDALSKSEVNFDGRAHSYKPGSLGRREDAVRTVAAVDAALAPSSAIGELEDLLAQNIHWQLPKQRKVNWEHFGKTLEFLERSRGPISQNTEEVAGDNPRLLAAARGEFLKVQGLAYAPLLKCVRALGDILEKHPRPNRRVIRQMQVVVKEAKTQIEIAANAGLRMGYLQASSLLNNNLRTTREMEKAVELQSAIQTRCDVIRGFLIATDRGAETHIAELIQVDIEIVSSATQFDRDYTVAVSPYGIGDSGLRGGDH